VTGQLVQISDKSKNGLVYIFTKYYVLYEEYNKYDYIYIYIYMCYTYSLDIQRIFNILQLLYVGDLVDSLYFVVHQPFCLFITVKEAPGFISGFCAPPHKEKNI